MGKSIKENETFKQRKKKLVLLKPNSNERNKIK